MSSEPAPRRARFLAFRLMLGALVGKVLGIVREIELARLLGAGIVIDAFRAGIAATLLPTVLLQSDLVASILIPLHRQWAADHTAPLRSALLAFQFFLLSLLVMAMVFLLADPWVGLLVSGFSTEAHALAVRFVRVMALGIPATVLAQYFSCIEISLGHSRTTVMRSSVHNLAVIGAMPVMVITGNPLAIGWAFPLSMTTTALCGLILLVREGELTLENGSFNEALHVGGTFLRRIRVLLVQPFAQQCADTIERSLASAVSIGALASIEYARSLTETALFLVSQPIGLVMLAQKMGDRAECVARVEALLRPLLAIALPLSGFILVFAHDIVVVVLQRGAFQQHAVELTSTTLRGISVGLWATTIGLVLLRMLSAAGRNRTAAAVVASAYVANALVNILLVPRIGLLGVGLGEATRGCALLVSAAWALGCGGLLLRRVQAMVLPVLGLVGVALIILYLEENPLLRLVFGTTLFSVGATASLLAFTPGLYQHLAAKLRVRLAGEA